MDITQLNITSVQKLLRNKEVSLEDIVTAHIKKAEENEDLNVFITKTFDQAMTFAKNNQSNQDYLKKPLAGVIMGYKDLFCTKDIRTTAGSKMLENFIPQYESTVTNMLNNAGAISIGKLNMDEFAMGSTNSTSYFGNCYNPIKPKDDPSKKLTPGGSSGGSASAVSAGVVMAATGSDTGGSIRQPAAFCDIVGLKPTYGRCSRYGMIAFASSLDQAGILAKNVEDSAILLQHMAGFDEKDSTSVDVAVPNYLETFERSIKGKKVGIIKEIEQFRLSDDIKSNYLKTQKILQDSGAEICEVSIPNIEHAIAVYYIIAPAEAASNLARYDGIRYGHHVDNIKNIDDLYCKNRSEGFGQEVKTRILIGNYVLSSGFYDAYYTTAQKIRAIIKQDMTKVFEKVDVLLTPTTPNTPFDIINEVPSNPVEIYLNDILTVSVNLAGNCAISIPTTKNDNGLPIGMQLIAPSFCEQRLFNFGFHLQQAFKN